MILVLTTLSKKEAAVKIGRDLLKKRVIACYNLLPIESAYWWKGRITEENEVLAILKTKDENFEKVKSHLKKHSGYETPEVVAIEASKVNKSYLNWIYTETKT